MWEVSSKKLPSESGKKFPSESGKNSPPLYAPKKSVIPLKKFTEQPISKIKETKKVIQISDESSFPIIGFARLVIPESKIEYPKEYKSFLCDSEFFRWSYGEHEKILDFIIREMRFSVFSSFICKLYGNNLTLFISTLAKYEGGTIDFEQYKNVLMNRPNDSPINKGYREIMKERKKLGLKQNVYYAPLLFYSDNSVYFGTFYSDEILTRNTRWSCIITRILRQNSSHFTFTFVDHKNQIVEFYDPHGRNVEPDLIEFIYESLSKIFPNYKVNKFWKLNGIQYTEDLEDEEKGFCVIWGMMMIHLKLLNINLQIEKIETSFIKECEKNKLSIYEVMLNYAYYMKRIIPEDAKKFITFEQNTTIFR
jgi:hypothetical protein